MKASWQQDFFDRNYLELYQPLLTEERTITEVKFLEKIAFDSKTKTILDMPCGYGRHSSALAEKGYQVLGIDSSRIMLKKARQELKNLPRISQKRLSYELADMRSYCAPKKFDAVLNLFTSFGYFEDAENEKVMENLCGSVRLGGVVVIDLRNPLRDIIELSATDWNREEKAGGVCIIQTLDPISMHHSLTYRFKDRGMQKEKIAIFREYFLPEMRSIFKKFGCRIEKTFGDFKANPYSAMSSRLIVVARRI